MVPFTHRLSHRSRLTGVALILVSLLATFLPTAVRAEDDILAPVTPTADRYESSPADLLAEDDVQKINADVQDARDFGVPFAVRVQSVPSPQQQESVQAAADALYEREPIESSAGADDGLLLLVQIPSNDKTQTVAAFHTGTNFFPKGGITQARLDRILFEVMQPMYADQTIGSAIVTGVRWVAYDQLFMETPGTERSNAQTWLMRVTNAVAVPILLALAAAYVVLAALVARATHAHRPDGASGSIDSPLTAASVKIGQVTHAISTAAIGELIELGALAVTRSGRQRTLTLLPNAVIPDPFLQRVQHRLEQIAGTDHVLPANALRTIGAVTSEDRTWLEHHLASHGFFASNARRVNRILRIVGVLVIAVALYALIPAIAGRAQWGIFAAAATIATVLVVIWWTSHRSFTTASGTDALAAWLDTTASDAARGSERALLDREVYALATQGTKLLDAQKREDRVFGPGATTVFEIIQGYGPA